MDSPHNARPDYGILPYRCFDKDGQLMGWCADAKSVPYAHSVRWETLTDRKGQVVIRDTEEEIIKEANLLIAGRLAPASISAQPNINHAAKGN
jgi:hypothetical protein